MEIFENVKKSNGLWLTLFFQKLEIWIWVSEYIVIFFFLHFFAFFHQFWTKMTILALFSHFDDFDHFYDFEKIEKTSKMIKNDCFWPFFQYCKNHTFLRNWKKLRFCIFLSFLTLFFWLNRLKKQWKSIKMKNDDFHSFLNYIYIQNSMKIMIYELIFINFMIHFQWEFYINSVPFISK